VGNAHYLQQLQERIEQVPEGNAHLWRDGRIVGQLEMRPVEDDPEVIYLSLIHLVPEYRSHGLGKMLHAHAMETARKQGKRLMRLSVSQSNQNAVMFYRRLGWVVVGTRPNVKLMAVMEVPVR
jgi:ribosomal protein S18 acetylase RimI-like enzyme